MNLIKVDNPFDKHLKKMDSNYLAVREIQQSDIAPITNYWFGADKAFLASMGADIEKFPSREDWIKMLSEQLSQPYHEKKSYCIIWLVNDEPVGHCNVNKILFGEEAYMHLHLWKADKRQSGAGTELVQMTIPWFFDNLQLKKIYCEPYSLNVAPNKTVQKLGFTFIKEYITTPGFINFEQPVKLWELTYDNYKKIK